MVPLCAARLSPQVVLGVSPVAARALPCRAAATGDGQVAQRSALTAGHKTILAALELPEPPRFFDFTVPTD